MNGRLLRTASVAGVLLLCGADIRAGSMDETWTQASRLLINESHLAFEQVQKSGNPAETREAEFGLAVTLLNVQPKIEQNIEKAGEIFVRLSRAAPADEIAISSKYYLARIEHVHRFKPDLEKAATLYEALIHEHPDHQLAQVAIVKLAMIELFADISTEEQKARYQKLEQRVPQLSDNESRKDLHLLLADTAMFLFADQNKSLEHLLAADEIGILRNRQRGTTWLRIADMARLTGKKDLAVSYYQRFVKEYQRDYRNYAAQQQLLEMQKATP